MEQQNTEELIKLAQSFIVSITDFPEKEMGGLLVNRVDFWKFRNKLSMVLQAKTISEQLANETRKISPDVLIPLLECSGKRENPRILKMFSSLLFAHLNTKTFEYVHSSYTSVLDQLSKEDVQIIDAMFAGIASGGFDYRTKCFEEETVMRLFKMSKPRVILSFQNVRRLGVCTHGPEPIELTQKNQIIFTDYGFNFMRACSFIK